jgi:hypothetical protein
MRLLPSIWNLLFGAQGKSSFSLGMEITDGTISRRSISIPERRRAEHIAIVGKTGTGKSSLLRYLMSQDIADGRGFVSIDLHGDLIPFVLSALAEKESRDREDLSHRILIIDPASPTDAIGINLLECEARQNRAVLISEIVTLLRLRWNLDHFGARTEELLRNSLWVLSENNMTLLEVSPLLTDRAFRIRLLKSVHNQEVIRYFQDRFDRASEAMQSVMREAVLNKVTAFTVDPAIRHIVGQTKSSLSLQAAVDQGFWILLNLRKGSLGENALTFAGLFLTKLKNAIFGRKNRNLFTIYADELPSLIAADDAFAMLLSESRKFAVSVVSANQFLNQFSPSMRSALFSVGTSLCFQLSAEDAPFMARVLNGETSLVRRLTTLPHRHLLGRFDEFQKEIFVPDVKSGRMSSSALVRRSMELFGKPRDQIEEEINARKPSSIITNNFDEWE